MQDNLQWKNYFLLLLCSRVVILRFVGGPNAEKNSLCSYPTWTWKGLDCFRSVFVNPGPQGTLHCSLKWFPALTNLNQMMLKDHSRQQNNRHQPS
ncbi:hypothetical protein CHARACLAT_023562 [Characodon lateralis]|uniref:Secreted protein n=1 Tax=Characodon lateralis TaxID=208331 RepID=A0ABU7EYP9_9TELE|nr:hypothetical protein [Characodon lateralis]